jgi:hypothetical protein
MICTAAFFPPVVSLLGCYPSIESTGATMGNLRSSTNVISLSLLSVWPCVCQYKTQRRTILKLTFSLFALVLSGIFLTPNLYADPLLTITNAIKGGVLVETPIAGGEQWVYNADEATLLGEGLFQGETETLTATFLDVLGVDVLNVTDVCADVAVFAPVLPCAGFAFSDTSVGVPNVVSATGNLATHLDVNVNAGDIDLAGVSIGGGSAKIDIINPNPAAVTPEPNGLTLLGTGLLGMAGVMKKKFCV